MKSSQTEKPKCLEEGCNKLVRNGDGDRRREHTALWRTASAEMAKVGRVAVAEKVKVPAVKDRLRWS
jgi:hypothetical protein